MSDLPLLPKATAVWLVDNTTLTFTQIAVFCGMHDLEVSGIADGEVAIGIKGLDPVTKGQLTREEIERCEKDPTARLKLLKKNLAPEQKKKAPRYTPLSKQLSDQFRTKVRNVDISGFDGAEAAVGIDVVEKYVFGINRRCL